MKQCCRTALVLGALGLQGAGALAGGWTSAARVAELQSNEFGRVLLRLDVENNPSGCRDSAWFYREQGNASAQMLDILLTAIRVDRPVTVYVSGLCHLKGYSEISAVSLAP